MYLENVPDLEKVLARFEAWWHCQIVDRPLVSIYVPADKPVPWPQKTHTSERDRWLDLEYNVNRVEAAVRNQRFVGESLPTYMPNLGPEICATAFGAELEFTRDSSWSKPIVSNCREVVKLKCNLEGFYWQTLRKLTDLSLQRGAGKWITGISDLHGNGDLLASLREPQELLLEMAEDLDTVKAAFQYLTPTFQVMYDDLYGCIHAAGQPTLSWIPSPHAGRMNVAQCDMICMISSEMFAQTVLPALQWEMRHVDRTIFHLDGPNALTHLDALLACRHLHGIQWVYGAGNGPAARWIDVYKRIQAGGKCMQLCCEDLADARKLMEHLRPEGCWFCVGGSYRLEEAQQFIREVEQWGAKAS